MSSAENPPFQVASTSATTHPLHLSHMFRVLIRTPARSFRILCTEPISRSITTSSVSRFTISTKMADSAQSTPVESSASTPAPSDTANANVPAQPNSKKQNNKKQNKPPHPNAANAKPKPVKREVRILMLHGTLTTFPGCTDNSFNCPSIAPDPAPISPSGLTSLTVLTST